MPHFLKFHRSTKSKAAPIHRCLLISEILSLILEFVRRFDESSENETKWDRTSGKRTLASLARTCRALSSPTLDVLWMRLDNLDPLIKVLPRRMWGRKHYPLVVRPFDLHSRLTTQSLSTGPVVHGREAVGNVSQVRRARPLPSWSLLARACHSPTQCHRCSCSIPKSVPSFTSQPQRACVERAQDVQSHRSERVSYQILCGSRHSYCFPFPHLLAQPRLFRTCSPRRSP